MSPAVRHPRSRTWPRALVLLLALLVAGPAAGLPAAPATTTAATTGTAEVTEYDVLGTSLRAAPCVHRPAAPPRPAPLPHPMPGAPAVRPGPAPSEPSYTPHVPRTVVLRC
ncbi:hypothetical protein ACFW91_38785 [Streptomyces asoensis]|uniref:hypothetical protein n=1 Tax=Streptomyces asoensis TaxID=249586 RepID=UPI0036A69176